ncbi:MAG: hypothetical protein KKD92_12445 [Proteobacteria bacterium]|nr:hypothetical protein [Pseudomonadota bacterium]
MKRSIQNITFKESPDSWQMKIQNFTRLPFPLAWILISLILLLIGYAVITIENEPINAMRLIILNSVLIAAIANSVVFYEKLLDDVADNLHSLLDEPNEKTKKWITYYYTEVFWSGKNIVAGLILGSICLLASINVNSEVYLSINGKIYSLFTAFIIGFFGGSMFWTMIGIARLTSDLGKEVQIKTSIFDSKTSLLHTASSVLWKVSITASVVYILGVSSYFFCSIKLSLVNFLIILIFGIFIVLYFIVPQINIHKTLVRIKSQRLKSLVDQIDITFDKVSANPTPENINQLKELFHLQSVVNGKKIWSFGTNELLILIGTVLVPLFIFIAKQFLDK